VRARAATAGSSRGSTSHRHAAAQSTRQSGRERWSSRSTRVQPRTKRSEDRRACEPRRPGQAPVCAQAGTRHPEHVRLNGVRIRQHRKRGHQLALAENTISARNLRETGCGLAILFCSRRGPARLGSRC
jgi:hypothetical protein